MSECARCWHSVIVARLAVVEVACVEYAHSRFLLHNFLKQVATSRDGNKRQQKPTKHNTNQQRAAHANRGARKWETTRQNACERNMQTNEARRNHEEHITQRPATQPSATHRNKSRPSRLQHASQGNATQVNATRTPASAKQDNARQHSTMSITQVNGCNTNQCKSHKPIAARHKGNAMQQMQSTNRPTPPECGKCPQGNRMNSPRNVPRCLDN